MLRDTPRFAPVIGVASRTKLGSSDITIAGAAFPRLGGWLSTRAASAKRSFLIPPPL